MRKTEMESNKMAEKQQSDRVMIEDRRNGRKGETEEVVEWR